MCVITRLVESVVFLPLPLVDLNTINQHYAMEDTTVMGPEGQDKSDNYLRAAFLPASSDRYNYPHKVGVWAEQVGAFADGGDTRAKGVANGLGYAL